MLAPIAVVATAASAADRGRSLRRRRGCGLCRAAAARPPVRAPDVPRHLRCARTRGAGRASAHVRLRSRCRRCNRRRTRTEGCRGRGRCGRIRRHRGDVAVRRRRPSPFGVSRDGVERRAAGVARARGDRGGADPVASARDGGRRVAAGGHSLGRTSRLRRRGLLALPGRRGSGGGSRAQLAGASGAAAASGKASRSGSDRALARASRSATRWARTTFWSASFEITVE